MKTSLATRRAFEKLVDMIWLPNCPICYSDATGDGMLCMDCWLKLEILHEPQCEFCGAEVNGKGAPICLECFENGRPWDFGIATTSYQGVGSLMVLRLKRMRAEHLAITMAKIAAQEHGDFFSEIDCLVPIPLHWTRQISRGFNQAGLLANALGTFVHKPVLHSALKRSKRTSKQVKLKSFEARFENLEAAFSLRDAEMVRGKRVCIVDDVMTSGASFEIATQVLRQAEPEFIAVYAFARAAQPKRRESQFDTSK